MIVNLAERARFLPLLYSDAGLVSRELARETAPAWTLPPFALSGSPTVAGWLFVAAGALALALVAGVAARFAAASLWCLWISLVQRNPMVSDAGDALLAILLFWGAWLPLGARLSLSSWRRGRALAPGTVTNAASAALLLQVVWLYGFAGLGKTGPMWSDGTAIGNALGMSYWARPAGEWLRGFPALCAGLTHAVRPFEVLGPLLLFSPWRTGALRAAALGALLAFQAVLALCLELWLLPFASSLALVPFAPASLWDRLAVRAGRAAGEEHGAPGRVAQVAVALLVASGVAAGAGARLGRDLLPRPVVDALVAAGLEQRWEMYADVVPFDLRLEIRGVLEDGRSLDLVRAEREGAWQRLRALADSYRGRLYWLWLAARAAPRHQERLGQWTCVAWNAGTPPARLLAVELRAERRGPAAAGSASAPDSALRHRVECGAARPSG